MPLYDYKCVDCGVFEMYAGREERFVECACGQEAERLPFSGVPHLKGETVATSIPDPVYRQAAQAKALHKTWGTAERSMEMLRKNVRTDAQGHKKIDLKAMNAT